MESEASPFQRLASELQGLLDRVQSGRVDGEALEAVLARTVSGFAALQAESGGTQPAVDEAGRKRVMSLIALTKQAAEQERGRVSDVLQKVRAQREKLRHFASHPPTGQSCDRSA